MSGLSNFSWKKYEPSDKYLFECLIPSKYKVDFLKENQLFVENSFRQKINFTTLSCYNFNTKWIILEY